MTTESRPDVASSSAAYARRFSGSIGQWMLEVQAEAVLRLIEPWPGASVLDVGGGHGQLAPRLRRAGFDASVLASGPDALEALDQAEGGAEVPRIVGNLHEPPLPDNSVDVALAVRMMAHVTDWRELLAGMSRVARHAVVIDFPASAGFNQLAGALFGLKKWVEGDTRPFVRLERAEVAAELEALGLAHHRVHAQYLFPMAMHRILRTTPVSRALEGAGRSVGLTSRYGSPLILRATFEPVSRG